jgi:rubrerythrin
VASTQLLLDQAERIERLSARAYAALATAFRDDAGAAALFARLRAEEEQHATRIRLLASHYRHQPKTRVHADAAALEASAAEVDRAVAEIEAGAWGFDFEAAVRRVAALEERLSDVHADLMARTANPAIRAFFEALAKQDEAHAALLACRGAR